MSISRVDIWFVWTLVDIFGGHVHISGGVRDDLYMHDVDANNLGALSPFKVASSFQPYEATVK
jgi:hypothetical protein